ncbi:MAG TPA: heparinase II/III family protein [Bryobacteraceae bacterium]|nr:heparinase II/III family protein [Bryobacteraceae bacterium]
MALGHVAALAALAQNQNDEDPLRQLRPAHPRLVLPDSDLERLRNTARDNPLGRRVYLDLERESERLLSAPTVEYKLTGTRLLPAVARIADRITTLSLMYRLTGRDPYLRRAAAELRATAAFRDWNPAHFTETAQLTWAVALGHDWLYNGLTPEDRAAFRTAILTKGLEPSLPIYQHEGNWPKDHYNATIICNAGMGIGALAIAGEPDADPSVNDKCRAILRYVLDSVPRGIATYGTEGSWPEGLDYWNAVSLHSCLLFGSLLTALGNDYGLSSSHGIDRAGRFRIHTTGPFGKVFNFGDAAEDAGLAPEMFWYARRFANPVYAWSEQKALERTSRPAAWDLVWMTREAKSPQQPPAWPLDAIFRGVDVACMRSSWEDPAALYVAAKGGDNKAQHAHLDLGSFILDAGGVRWACDLGPDDYELPGYFGRGRWSYYRTRTEAHNTLSIDGENQDPRAEARITRQEVSPDLTWISIDLSRAHPGKVRQWTRRVGMAQRQAVLIEDSLRSDQLIEVIWGMMTDADITLNGQTALLKKNGWNLAAEIRSPRRAVFDIAPVRSAPGQASNNGYRKLIVRLGDKVTDLDLSIQFAPFKDGQPRPKLVTQSFPA